MARAWPFREIFGLPPHVVQMSEMQQQCCTARIVVLASHRV
jgi:hypothetical protein